MLNHTETNDWNATNLSSVVPRNHPQVFLQVCMACTFQEVCPIWGRMAENNWTLCLEADDECHGKQCYFGKTNGRYYQAARVHNDHQPFWPQQSRKRLQQYVQSFRQQEMKEHHQRYPGGDLQVDGYKGPQSRKAQLTDDAGSEYGGIKTCSDACSDAQSTAMCPWPALRQLSAQSEQELRAELHFLMQLPSKLSAIENQILESVIVKKLPKLKQ